MAKKSSKHHSKPANTVTTEITAPPAASPPSPVSSSAPISSSEPPRAPYKPITDDVSIERLVGLAKDSPPDSALGIVWKHAYEEAYQNGRKEVLQNLGKKLEEKYKEGRKEGIKEGKDLHYGRGMVKGEYEEHQKWKMAGHGQHCFAPTAVLDNASTQTDPLVTNTTSISIQTSPTTFTTMSQLPEMLETRKNTKIGITSEFSSNITNFFTPAPSLTSTSSPTLSTTTTTIETRSITADFAQNYEIGTTSENLQKIAVSSSQMPSSTLSNTTAPTTSIVALKTRSTTANSTENHQKIENLLNISPNTSPNLSPSILEHTDDVSRVHASLITHNDVVLRPPTFCAAASSSQQAITLDRKSELSDAVFESQPSTDTSKPTCFVTARKMRSASADFTENGQKVENQPKFNQNHPKPPTISNRFSWADDANTLPIASTAPQYPPRDLSCLRSTSTHPFSSLQRQRGRPKNRQNIQRRRQGQFHSSSQTPFQASITLDWDRDPRLADLSSALHALGWVRR